MKILALDFSTLRRSAAVLELAGGGEADVISCLTQEARRADSPFPLIAEALGKIRRDEIEAIAVGLGPGSYTGIRSSLAIAQGWNLARSIPAAGLSSADAIAYNAWAAPIRGGIEVVIDAQRGEVYSAIYELTDDRHFTIVRPLGILEKPLNENRLVGPEASRWAKNGLIVEPTAAGVGILAAKAQFGPPENLEPIYLREPSFLKAPAIRHA